MTYVVILQRNSRETFLIDKSFFQFFSIDNELLVSEVQKNIVDQWLRFRDRVC